MHEATISFCRCTLPCVGCGKWNKNSASEGFLKIQLYAERAQAVDAVLACYLENTIRDASRTISLKLRHTGGQRLVVLDDFFCKKIIKYSPICFQIEFKYAEEHLVYS